MTQDQKQKIINYTSFIGSILVLLGAGFFWLTTFQGYYESRSFSGPDLLVLIFLGVQVCNIIVSKNAIKDPELRKEERKTRIMKLKLEQKELEKKLSKEKTD